MRMLKYNCCALSFYVERDDIAGEAPVLSCPQCIADVRPVALVDVTSDGVLVAENLREGGHE